MSHSPAPRANHHESLRSDILDDVARRGRVHFINLLKDQALRLRGLERFVTEWSNQCALCIRYNPQIRDVNVDVYRAARGHTWRHCRHATPELHHLYRLFRHTVPKPEAGCPSCLLPTYLCRRMLCDAFTVAGTYFILTHLDTEYLLTNGRNWRISRAGCEGSGTYWAKHHRWTVKVDSSKFLLEFYLCAEMFDQLI